MSMGFQGFATVLGVLISVGILAYEFYRTRQQYNQEEPHYNYGAPPPSPPPETRRRRRRCHGEECSICQEVLTTTNNSLFVVELKCSHVFHKACIEKWMRQQRTCPLCRVSF